MTLEMSLDYRLRWLDFDRYGHMRPESILDVFQDAATLQAEDMGIGRADMLAKGVFWAVVRLKYIVVHEPERFQIVTVRTWPHTLSSFSFLRDFQMLDEAGKLLVKARTEWVVMDSESRKFARVKNLYTGPTDFSTDRALDEKLRKVPDFEAGNRPVRSVVPAYTDIDANGHVNNARYTNFIVDALDPEPGKAIKSLQIDYRHEALPNTPLDVHTLVENERVLSKGVREDGNVSFACAIELE